MLPNNEGRAVTCGSSESKRISVMHLIHTMAHGGVETALINWVRRIDKGRFEVHIVCFANPGGTEQPFVDAAESDGFTVSKIPWGRRKPLLKASRRLARLLREHQVEILHTHNCYADVVGILASKFVPVKTITTLYVWADFGWKRNLIQFINQLTIPFFDQITAHCEHTRLETIKRGISANRTKTLICGFETHRVELSVTERLRRRRKMGIADDEVVLVNIARFYPEKGHASLLHIFKHIRQRCPQTRLWIAGIGPLETKIRALSTQLGLDASVSFLGFVKDLPDLLALVDIQVHPSHSEGVPLAICEGMAASIPIVASEVGGLPEILNYGLSGILIRPGDDHEFVDAVVRLVHDPEERALLGQSARHFIENNYSLTRAVSELELTYQGLWDGCVSPASQ